MWFKRQLSCVAEKGQERLAKEKGADVDSKDLFGQTPYYGLHPQGMRL